MPGAGFLAPSMGGFPAADPFSPSNAAVADFGMPEILATMPMTSADLLHPMDPHGGPSGTFAADGTGALSLLVRCWLCTAGFVIGCKRFSLCGQPCVLYRRVVVLATGVTSVWSAIGARPGESNGSQLKEAVVCAAAGMPQSSPFLASAAQAAAGQQPSAAGQTMTLDTLPAPDFSMLGDVPEGSQEFWQLLNSSSLQEELPPWPHTAAAGPDGLPNLSTGEA